jgi:hypothetical protein
MSDYQLKSVQPMGTYFIDLIVEPYARTPEGRSKFIYYLIAVNTLSRFVYVVVANNQEVSAPVGPDGRLIDVERSIEEMGMNNARLFVDAMRKILEQAQTITGGNPIMYLRGDAQLSFTSRLAQEFYRQNGITFSPVPREKNYDPTLLKRKSAPIFRAEGILNRVVRTLRDFAYKLRPGPITPDLMSEVVMEYNTRPNRAFRIAYHFPLSPLTVERDIALQMEILRHERAENMFRTMSDGYQLNGGEEVKVKNPRDPMVKHRAKWIPNKSAMRVIDYRRGLFHVQEERRGGFDGWVARSQIKPID